MDLLKKIQSAGKAVEIRCSAEEIPLFHKELRPEKVVYITGCQTQKQAGELEDWLKDNT